MASCGGHVNTGTSDAAVMNDGQTDLDSGSTSACNTSGGVRLCGGPQCPALPAPQCPGEGCTTTMTSADASSGIGVCWADLADHGQSLCFACADGDACVYRHADELICVPVAVCERLFALGATNVCRYADKTRYDNRPLPASPAGCPGGLEGQHILCGGGCGDDCFGEPCVGRSPTHPYGICASADPVNLGSVSTCSVTSQGLVRPCPANTDDACAIFDTETADQSEARRYGLCLGRAVCQRAAAVLPGGSHVCSRAG